MASARTSVVEAVGTQESTMQAIGATRAGGHMGFVGVNYDVAIPGIDLFFAGIHVHGGPAPVRRFLPDLIHLIWDRKIDPGKVFDLTLPLETQPRATRRWTSVAPPRCYSPSIRNRGQVGGTTVLPFAGQTIP